jgi:hypothetical protein
MGDPDRHDLGCQGAGAPDFSSLCLKDLPLIPVEAGRAAT